MAIRRSPHFRFDYFFRSLPVDVIGRRCEILMKAALKEVELLEKKFREDVEISEEVEESANFVPVTLPKFEDIQKNIRTKKTVERGEEKKNYEEKVEKLESQIEQIQNSLKQSRDPGMQQKLFSTSVDSFVFPSSPTHEVESDSVFDDSQGAIGPFGEFVEFPRYDGSERPREPRKAFAQFCQRTRKSIKNSLNLQDRKDKEKVNGILREKFTSLLDEERQVYRGWAAWDKLRHLRDLKIFERVQKNDGAISTKDMLNQIPKKRNASDTIASVPKKKKH